MTTREISNYIWDISSGYNVRSHKPKPSIDPLLRQIQKYFYQGQDHVDASTTVTVPKKNTFLKIKKSMPSDKDKRTSFLILFGKKYKVKGYDVVIAGTIDEPIRMKIDNEWMYSSDIKLLNAYPETIVTLNDYDPPFGFKWIKNKVTTRILNSKPFVDDTEIGLFDGSSVIESIRPDISKRINTKLEKIITIILSGQYIDFDILLKLRTHKNFRNC